MSDRNHVETTCIIQAAGLAWLPETIQVRLLVSRIPTDEPDSPSGAALSGHLPPFRHKYSIGLSEENWQGLRNLSYWRRGRAGSRVAIINQALAFYLARYEESGRPIPEGEEDEG